MVEQQFGKEGGVYIIYQIHCQLSLLLYIRKRLKSKGLSLMQYFGRLYFFFSEGNFW